MVISGLMSKWEVSIHIPQRSVLGPVPFNIFMNDLKDGIECEFVCSKFVNDTKLGRVADTLKHRIGIQNDLSKLENGSKLIKLNSVMTSTALHLRQKNHMHKYRLDFSSAEKKVGSW